MTIELQLRLKRSEGFALKVETTLPDRGVSVVYGPSGSGKTTLLRCLAGLERTARGRVVVDGQVWQDGRRFLPAHRRSAGLVFQDAALFPHLTVRGNLDYALRRIPGSQPRPTLDSVIAMLALGPLLQRRPDSLSGGERQRVAIARALAMAPRLLLLDEPLASLDAARRAELLPYLDRLHEMQSLPMVYVTHSMTELTRLADHVLVMDQGRVAAAGPTQAMLSRLESPLAQEDEAGVVVPCTVVSRDEQWQLARFEFEGGSLTARDTGQKLGSVVRVRVLARDVSLALAEPVQSSIANCLRGTLRALAPDRHPALTLAAVRVGSAIFVARLTRHSADRLGLKSGMTVWVQVKSVALLE